MTTTTTTKLENQTLEEMLAEFEATTYKITRDTFEKLSTLKKYNVEFQSTPYNYKERVCISTNNTGYCAVYYYYEISTFSEKEYVLFRERFSMNNGKTSKSFKTGYNFEKRIVRDLQKANLI